MQRIELPNFPQDLTPTSEVRDYELDNGKFARVIMELDPMPVHGHFVVEAQAYEMTADGQFVPAPLGFPSRTTATQHTAQESALGTTLKMDDGWVQVTEPFVPEAPGDIVVGTGEPTSPPATPGYGQGYYDQALSRVYRWREGFADGIARAKCEELIAILQTSAIRSGLGFR